MPGDELTVTNNRPLHVTVRAWGLAGHSAPVHLRLIKLGTTAKEIAATEAKQAELKLETTLDSEHGFWLAAYAQGRDGSEALTTPVYVTRAGFRFWNVAEAEAG